MDDEDFDELSKYRWDAHKERFVWYATRYQKNGVREYTRVRMHRQIMGAVSEQIDHKDGDGLNNQKRNLRFCTNSQNLMNSRTRKDNSSGFKGVTYHRKNKKWRTQLHLDGKSISAGCHATKEQAAMAYNRKAAELFGDFARLNTLAGQL